MPCRTAVPRVVAVGHQTDHEMEGEGEDAAELLLESEGEAAEDVRLGGGRKETVSVFWLTKLLGEGGGGGGLLL
jgi:hypothetical protein